ncbi:MAG TPA: cysteine peptidase family C39 domain-containing protein, partial [Planktothrix sp.]
MNKRINIMETALRNYRITHMRVLSLIMSALLMLTTMPALPAYAAPSLVVPQGAGPPKLGVMPDHAHIRGSDHKPALIVPKLSFSSHPSDLEISNARAFSEPLVAMTGPPVAGENEALATALVSFKSKNNLEAVSDLTNFLKAFPKSRWAPAVQLNLAQLRFETGYLTDALSILNSAWQSSKNEQAPGPRAIANRSAATLMLFDARLGFVPELKQLIADTKDRAFLGSDELMVKESKQGLWRMQNTPEEGFKCGPCAIDTIVRFLTHKPDPTNTAKNAKSTCNGTNLSQINGWAKQAGLNLQMAKRSPGAPLPLPAVMHWSIGHFAAVTDKENGKYIAKDTTFDFAGSMALSPTALEQATDGYFLIPAGKLPSGWRSVSDQEAQTVWGKGGIGGPDPYHKQPEAPGTCSVGGGGGGRGMAGSRAYLLSATLNIWDVPLSYHPPIGPPIDFRANYNHLESSQPSTFTFANLGPDWTFGWTSYLSLDGQNNAFVRLRTGGVEDYYISAGVYVNDFVSSALLVNMGGGVFQRQLPDGSIEVFSQPDGSGNTFLTQVIDPQGNAATLSYDANLRITSITDAINQVSTVSYVSNTVGSSGFYKVASVSDPFGRSCSFTYDSTNTFLLSITDSIGLVSKFNYDTSSSFISAMTTPYGTTGFSQFIPSKGGYNGQGLRFAFADGSSSIIENFWNGVTTYYWDREAMAQYPAEQANAVYTHCKSWQFQEEQPAIEGTVPASYSDPLESTTTYSYQADVFGLPGNLSPSRVTKKLGSQPVNITIGGTATSGDVVRIIVEPAYPLSSENVNYTVSGTDTPTTIATGVANALNTDPVCNELGLQAAASGTNVSVSCNNDTVEYSWYIGGTGTETVNIAAAVPQYEEFTVGGTPTTGDNVGIQYTVFNNSYQSISYTVLGGDTLSSIAAGLAAAINANTTLQEPYNAFTATSVGPVLYVTSLCAWIPQINYNGGSTETLTFTANTNAASLQSNAKYNSFGLKTQSIDPMLRTFNYSYAANNIDLTQVTETQRSDDFQVGAWTYNSQHRPLTYTDGSGQVTTYSYNTSGELTKIVDAASNTTTLTYTGTCTATIGGTITASNTVTITTHDPALAGGQKSDTYTVLAGDTTTTIATGLKNLINADTSLQAIGVSATSSGAVVTMSSTSTNVTTYTTSTSGGATETLTLGVNTFGYLTQIDGPLSGHNDVTTFTWDTVGRLASVTDSEGYTVEYGYDNADRLLLTTYPDSSTEQIIYDRLDAVLRKDRIGRWTQDAFDVLDQLAYETDPLGRKTQYTWCVCGSLGSLTDPNGHQTTWQHDLLGRVVGKTYADGTSVAYEYEADTSRLHEKTDALNQSTFYSYSPDNTPLQVSYRNAVNSTGFVTYAWDQYYRRLSSVAKSDWGTISYTYNAYDTPLGAAITGGGMLQKVHNNVIANSDVTYTYDNLGRTTNRSINGASNSVTWTYDAMSRITQEANALGNFGYSYVDDVSGSSKGTLRLSSISYPNSQVTNFSWYPTAKDERLQQISNLSTSGSSLSQFNYVYDSAGQITQWQQQQNGGNLFYNLGYDAAGQLTSAQAGSGSPNSPFAKEYYYNYDPGANRTGVQQTSLQTLRIGGTKTTGNTLTVTVKDPALSGGQEAVTYTVLSSDTLATIAAGVATAINADTNLQSLGVIANAHGTNTFVNIRSVSANNTTYSTSTSGGATETMTFGIFQNGTESATVGGTKATGDVL